MKWLADFRVEKQKELDELFTQMLAALSQEGLITLVQVMQDGTKIKALASTRSYRQEETIREHLEQARRRVAETGDPPGRREQSEDKASPGPRATRATRAVGGCAGRVAEVAGMQERRKDQEGAAGKHQRSASASDEAA